MKESKENKKFRWQEWLLAFLITCVLFAIVIGLTVIWSQNNVIFEKSVMWSWMRSYPEFWIGNGAAFFIVFLVIHHFIKKPKDPDQYHDNYRMK